MNRSRGNKRVVLFLVASVCFFVAACGNSKIRGTYSNDGGTVVLDLRSGGEASITMMGETEACTYKVEKSTLHLTCGEHQVDFAIHEDGSLTGPGFFIGVLRKSKS
jgi:hypothetical protein